MFVTMMDIMFGNLVFDCTDGFIVSPRFMSLFTISLTEGSSAYKPGKTASAELTATNVQSLIIKYLPFLIGLVHHGEVLCR